MAPKNTVEMLAAHPPDECNFTDPVLTVEKDAKPYKAQIVWKNVVWMSALHLAALYGMFLIPWAHPLTWLWTIIVYVFSALGITAGVHRLWAHRSYKAKLPLRIFLAVINSMASQNDIIEWARDHRVHHKYSETDADPHNAKRGFFFAHCGWLLCRKHPEVKAKGKLLDVSDLLQDPVCIWQRKLYLPSVILMCFVFPTVVPWYFWGESLWNGYFISSIMRYVLTLNVTWFVNSWAHMYGNKPYDSNINPAENFFVTFGAIGEGFHNYHHTFPMDYATSEYGWRVNLSTFFIDCMATLGQAYGMKKMSHEAVFRRKNRTGDGTAGFGYGQEPQKSDSEKSDSKKSD